MLNVPDYLLSVLALALTIGPLALGATRIRGQLLPAWSGPPARLADTVLTIGLLLLIAELIGAVGHLQRGWLLAASLTVGVGVRLALATPSEAGRAPPAPPTGVWAKRIAVLIGAALVAHWSIGTIDAYGAGMTGYDSAWYHMPFAAHFAQSGSSLDFVFVSPRYLSWFYPQNSELLHGVGMVLTGRDALSPSLNMLWLVGCLLAAWCVGRPFGLGAWTLAAAAVLLDAGLMADQAGEARNDTMALFLLLAAVAFIVNGEAAAGSTSRTRAGPLVLAGLAAGLAAGTKLSFLASVAALVVATPFLAAPGRRRLDLAAFGIPVLAGGGFWYLRNLASAGNPLPWLKAVGPLQLSGPDQGLGGRHQASVLDYIGDGTVWNRWFEGGLGHRIGEAWPLLVGIVLVVLVVALIRGTAALKLVAVAALAGAVAYLVDGTSAEGPPGHPVGFASSLRHLLPVLCLGLVLMPLLPRLSSLRGRTASAVVLAVLLAGADRTAEPWPLEYLIAAIVLAALLLVALARPRPPHAALIRRPTFAAAAAGLIVAVTAGGWLLQRSYLSDRYAGEAFRSPGLNAAFAWANGQHDKRIATTLTLLYPLYGTDLSNRVEHLGLPQPDGGFTRATSCDHWLRAVNRGRFDYLVVNDRPGLVDSDRTPAFARSDARLVFERRLIEVFRILGPLGRSACATIHREPIPQAARRPADARRQS